MNSKPYAEKRSSRRTRLANAAKLEVRQTLSTRTFVICCLALGIFCVAIYARIAWHPFVNFDDGPYVFENSHVQGDRANARANFLHALHLSPENPTELYNLSLLEIRDGIDNLTRTISVKPTPEGYLQLGQLLQEDQRTGDAQLAYEKALRLNPHLSEARQALRDLKQNRE